MFDLPDTLFADAYLRTDFCQSHLRTVDAKTHFDDPLLL